MGTRYERSTEIQSEVEIIIGQEAENIEIEHIESVLMVGYQVEINLRQVSTLDFIQMVRSDSSTTIVFDNTSIQAGEYVMIIESFDALSVA